MLGLILTIDAGDIWVLYISSYLFLTPLGVKWQKSDFPRAEDDVTSWSKFAQPSDKGYKFKKTDWKLFEFLMLLLVWYRERVKKNSMIGVL